MDWAGEFNSFIVPYAPFGRFTISRSPQPQTFDYLYDLSEADGADQTRAADTGTDSARNGEPEGELGLVIQKDSDWQDQTGAPDDPQPGNIPGGARDVLESATFNQGSMAMEAFAPDSGVWEVQNGSLRVTAESLGGDAASVFHVDEILPSYFEIKADIAVDKPLAGWKSNAYIIFDYYGPDDFKFAGVNESINKMQMGHKTAEGWVVDVQSNFQLKANQTVSLLVAVHGTTVTLLVEGTEFFTHVFDPRVDEDGWVYGLNTGMVGFGSDNSRGIFDNIAVQQLPPEITFEDTDDFSNTTDASDMFNGSNVGVWSNGNGRYSGTPAAGEDEGWSLVELGLGHGLDGNSVLEIEAVLNTDSTGGIIFDSYGPKDYKFAVIDAVSDQLVIGHRKGNKWDLDAVTDVSIETGVDYTLSLSLKGSTVDAKVRETGSGSPGYLAIVGHAYNAVTVDGSFGLLTKDGSSSFDEVTVKTDDPTFLTPEDAEAMTAASSQTDSAEVMSDLTYNELDPIIDAAINRWTGSTLFDEAMLNTLEGLTFVIADLSGDTLALAVDDTVIIDVDAAGHGWFIDDTPYQDSEFMPQNNDEVLTANESSDAYGDMDLLTVVMHELGHVFGYQDMDPATNDAEIMNETLDEGVRYLPEDTFSDQTQNNSDSLISMDLTPDANTADDTLDSLVNDNPWLIKYLLNGAEDDTNPNDDISVVIPEEDPQGGNTEESSDPVDDPGSKGKGNNK
jgi:hypothetical protein